MSYGTTGPLVKVLREKLSMTGGVWRGEGGGGGGGNAGRGGGGAMNREFTGGIFTKSLCGL